MDFEIEPELLAFNVNEIGQFSLEQDDLTKIKQIDIQIKKKQIEISALRELKIIEEQNKNREIRMIKSGHVPIWMKKERRAKEEAAKHLTTGQVKNRETDKRLTRNRDWSKTNKRFACLSKFIELREQKMNKIQEENGC